MNEALVLVLVCFVGVKRRQKKSNDITGGIKKGNYSNWVRERHEKSPYKKKLIMKSSPTGAGFVVVFLSSR